MAFFTGSNQAIDSQGIMLPVVYATRANLPTSGVTGYLAYLTESNDIVFNTNVSNSASGSQSTLYWYKFLTKPMDYKNEVLLEQGTVGGGYVGSSIYNTITRINSVTDVLCEDSATMSMALKYGGWHSTYLNAYYHGGDSGTTTSNYQSWATGTVTTNNSQPTYGSGPTSVQPGPKQDNTRGVIIGGTSGGTGSWYITFSTNTWTSGGYDMPSSQRYGAGTFGQAYGYGYTYNSGGVYRLNWSNSTWSSTGSGNHTSGAEVHGKILGTKWDKFYHGGDNSSTSMVTVSWFNMATNVWAATGSNQPYAQGEQSCVMSQDWGYWLGGYGVGGTWGQQNEKSMKTWYATDTIAYYPKVNGWRALSSGSGCWGPVP